MKPTITVQKGGIGTAKLRKALNSLARMDAYVGIPEEKTPRKGTPVTNAGLLYIHTHGSALRHIPARPVIEPAIAYAANRAIIADHLKDAAAAVIAGKPAQAESDLNAAGTAGARAARDWFTNPANGWAPNTAATIAAKGSDQPLIDTHQMIRAITYVLAEK
jgi:hypothetical protein